MCVCVRARVYVSVLVEGVTEDVGVWVRGGVVDVAVSSVYAGARRLCHDSSQCVRVYSVRQWVRVKEYDEPSSNKYSFVCCRITEHQY